MAFIQASVMVKSLMRTVSINVILPSDKLTFPGMPQRENKPFKTLYLLHGVFGSNVDWVNGTRIQRFAEENDLAVVMPAGENRFYVDQPKGHNYFGKFIGEELVEITRKMFPLSDKREDTFIGGLSMGGYGALRNGLKYSDTFGAIVALSSALLIDDMEKRTNDSPFFIDTRDYAEACFGDLTNIVESDKNPEFLIEQLLADKKEIPQIFMACGDQDSLLGANKKFSAFLTEKKIPHVLEIGPGNHEWDFWDTYIKKAIYEWLPTEHNGQGITSGNIGK